MTSSIVDGRKRIFIFVFSGQEFGTKEEASKEAKRRKKNRIWSGINKIFSVKLKISCVNGRRAVEEPEKKYVLASMVEVWNYPKLTVGQIMRKAEEFDSFLRGESNFYEIPPPEKKKPKT